VAIFRPGLIEQRGIDFAPAEDFLQNLKAAGADEAFLEALRAAKPPGPAAYHGPTEPGLAFPLSRANPPFPPRQNAIARK
jgi:predicted NAD-dependent protein-ADP-ribosyltransferase YbiA (DUF1768 family)